MIKMELDRYDYQILQLLQTHGRMSNQELADQIGLSPSPCLRRVRALEESGIISAYHAIVDAKQLGYALMALISIAMDKHTDERFKTFEQQIQEIPEVLECLLITGQTADYQLKVIVKDLDHYQDLLLNRINRITGVTSVHTSFVLRKVVNKLALPLD